MSDSKHILAGITDDLALKAQIAASLTFVNQVSCRRENPELLKWCRNRLSEPYKSIQTKLIKMGEYELPDAKKIANGNKIT